MQKLLLPLAATALLAVSFSQPARADEAAVRKAIESKLGVKVSSVAKSGYLGLYEVYAEGQIVYTDEKVTAIVGGPLFDAKTMKNVTSERMQKLTAIKFSDLPLEYAVKQVRGDGKRILASFEDPNCGYCKRFERDLQQINNVTVYLFLYPILSPDSAEKSRNIWCSKDQATAWQDQMVRDKPAPAASCDTSALQRNLAFGKKYKITGTPTLIFANGTRVPGAIGAQEVEKRLAEAASDTPSAT